MAVRRLDPLPCLVGNEIGSDKACASCIREISGEAFNPIMVDEVPVAHDERHSTGIGHRLHGLEHIGYALAIVQGDLAGGLDHRAIHHRIGIRQSYLDNVSTVLDHRGEGLE